MTKVDREPITGRRNEPIRTRRGNMKPATSAGKHVTHCQVASAGKVKDLQLIG